MFNYFNFKQIGNDFLLTNDFGNHIFIENSDFRKLLSGQNNLEYSVKKELEEKNFLHNGVDSVFLPELTHQLRNNKSYLFNSTQLNIFVVTTACNLNCVYCQAQSDCTNTKGYMTKEVAKKSVDIALQSPSRSLEFEFQGGEPTLNFEVIKFIIEYTEENKINRDINYSIVTNLTLLTDEMVEFILKYKINIATSLDGNEIVHNSNRLAQDKSNSFNKVVKAIQKLKALKINVGAIQTTTRASLMNYKEIIDTYIDLGFENIFIRPLTPLGQASSSWNEIGYTTRDFIEFYINAVEYIIEKNNNGIVISESYTNILLEKILNKISPNYMELRSPCGASVGQLAYYYNGSIYTCDEGRMLSEMGNDAFLLGNVAIDDYNSIMDCSKCKAVCSASIIEALPSCSDCVYQPFCGVCPVVNYALDKDVYEKSPNGYKCVINKEILDFIFKRIRENKICSIDEFWG